MTPAPGPILTLWHDGGARVAWEGSRELVERVQPPVVMLHSWPAAGTRAVLDAIRAAVPSVRVWIGCGADGIAHRVRDGSLTPSRAAHELGTLAEQAAALGAECLVYDPESQWCSTPGSDVWQRLETAATAGLAEAAAHGIALGVTSFDHPQWHALDWRAWCGTGSPVAVHLPQQYAAPADSHASADLAAARARRQRSDAQLSTAVAAGRIRADLVGPGVYVQAHHVAPAGTVAIADGRRWVACWAAPTRLDAAGTLALEALVALWRQGAWDAGTLDVRAWQAAHGLQPDGVVGKLTLAALGLTD